MERALLQGEREAERGLLQKEQKAVEQLQEKLATLESGIQKERDKVTHGWPGWGRGSAPSRPLTPSLVSHPADLAVPVSPGSRGPCPLWQVPA